MSWMIARGMRGMPAQAWVGRTHFNVAMVSARFSGLSRVERSRLVHEALGAEFEGGLHALSLALRSPSEISSQTAITRT